MSKPELHIVVSCTASKNLSTVLSYDGYVNQPHAWLNDAHDIDLKMPALDLYKGPGADKFRAIREHLSDHYGVTLWVLSAGFGLVREDDMLPGYDATFSSMAKNNRVRPPQYESWLKGVTRTALPKGAVIMLPQSYLKPFKALENIKDHYSILAGSFERDIIGCSMIRVELEFCELLVNYALENDIPPAEWPNLTIGDIYA